VPELGSGHEESTSSEAARPHPRLPYTPVAGRMLIELPEAFTLLPASRVAEYLFGVDFVRRAPAVAAPC
jgi:hypothetical protein